MVFASFTQTTNWYMILMKSSPRTSKKDLSKDHRSRSEAKTFEMCIFKRHLQYLGHFILGYGIYPLKEKVALLINLSTLEM